MVVLPSFFSSLLVRGFWLTSEVMMIFGSLVDGDCMRQDKDRFRHLVATFQDCLCSYVYSRKREWGEGRRGQGGRHLISPLPLLTLTHTHIHHTTVWFCVQDLDKGA